MEPPPHPQHLCGQSRLAPKMSGRLHASMADGVSKTGLCEMAGHVGVSMFCVWLPMPVSAGRTPGPPGAKRATPSFSFGPTVHRARTSEISVDVGGTSLGLLSISLPREVLLCRKLHPLDHLHVWLRDDICRGTSLAQPSRVANALSA